MAVPTIADKTSGLQNTNGSNVTADISGWTLAEGDLLAVLVGLDGARSGTVSLTQTGFTEHADAPGGDSRITVAVYSKVLTSSDTSWTEIEATWTGSEKAHIDVVRIADGDHDGIDTFAISAFRNEDEGTTPELPAITAATNSLGLGFVTVKGSVTVTVNPTGYTTENTNAPTAGGHSQSWLGSAGLSGAQSANTFTLSAAQDGAAAILTIAEAASGDDYTLVTVDLSVSSTLDTTTIVQNHVLSPVDSSVSVSLDTSILTQNHVLSPVDLSVSTILDTTTVVSESDDYTLSPAGLSVSSTLDTTAIAQAGVLAPDDLSVSSTLDTTTIAQNHILGPLDLSVTTTLDTTLVILPSDVSTASISLGASFSGSVSLGTF